jgi:hypothetical protein
MAISDNTISQILKVIMKKMECTTTRLDDKLFQVNIKGLPIDRKYTLEFYEVDKAGTLGVKIRWIIGEISDSVNYYDLIVLNSDVLIDRGILYSAIFKINHKILLGLVGSAVFPFGTSPGEASNIIINHAMINYFFGALPNISGVNLF